MQIYFYLRHINPFLILLCNFITILDSNKKLLNIKNNEINQNLIDIAKSVQDNPSFNLEFTGTQDIQILFLSSIKLIKGYCVMIFEAFLFNLIANNVQSV